MANRIAGKLLQLALRVTLVVGPTWLVSACSWGFKGGF